MHRRQISVTKGKTSPNKVMSYKSSASPENLFWFEEKIFLPYSISVTKKTVFKHTSALIDHISELFCIFDLIAAVYAGHLIDNWISRPDDREKFANWHEYLLSSTTSSAYYKLDGFPFDQISMSLFSHKDRTIFVTISIWKLKRKVESEQTWRTPLPAVNSDKKWP